MKKYIYILSFLIIIVIYGCPKEEMPFRILKIVNNSDLTLVYEYSVISYPFDTVLSQIPRFPKDEIDLKPYIIYPNSTKSDNFYKDGVEYLNTDSIHLSIAIYNIDTVLLNDWDKIYLQHLCLKQWILSVDSLDKLDWTIEYP